MPGPLGPLQQHGHHRLAILSRARRYDRGGPGAAMSGLADVSLVISHARRHKVIREWMAERRPPVPTLTIPKGADASSQELIIWEGTVLTAVLDGLSKLGIYNA